MYFFSEMFRQNSELTEIFWFGGEIETASQTNSSIMVGISG